MSHLINIISLIETWYPAKKCFLWLLHIWVLRLRLGCTLLITVIFRYYSNSQVTVKWLLFFEWLLCHHISWLPPSEEAVCYCLPRKITVPTMDRHRFSITSINLQWLLVEPSGMGQTHAWHIFNDGDASTGTQIGIWGQSHITCVITLTLLGVPSSEDGATVPQLDFLFNS